MMCLNVVTGANCPVFNAIIHLQCRGGIHCRNLTTSGVTTIMPAACRLSPSLLVSHVILFANDVCRFAPLNNL